MNSNRETFEKIEALYQDSAVRDRKFYPDFRTSWNALLESACESDEEYFPPDGDSVVVIHSDYGGLDFVFRLKNMVVRRLNKVLYTLQKLQRKRLEELCP